MLNDASLTEGEHRDAPTYAELHRHLDGSLRRQTLQELADQIGLVIPLNLGFYPGMGLRKALACFEVTLSALQTPQAVKRVAAEMCEDATREGTTYLEIRFAPQLHRGAPPEEIVDAAIEGLEPHAHLILCGLYGEHPDVLGHLVDIAKHRPKVVGIDLAGGPQHADEWRMADYALPFDRARELGLGRTVHAGEGRPPHEIRVAIETLHATRIGHGTTLLDDPEVLDLVLREGVTIEACPTSNLQTSAISSADAHPLPRWLKLGVRACICTDNTLLSSVNAPQEHHRASQIPGMTSALISQAIENAHQAAFAPQ